MKILFKYIYYIGIFLIIIFSITIYTSYLKLNKNIVDSSISYSSSDNSNYEVIYSGTGKTNNDAFIRKYVDTINFNFNYLLNFSSIVSGYEEVVAKASVVVMDPNGDSIIYRSNPDYLLKDSFDYKDTGLFRSNNSITIPYKKYLDIYNNFKDDTSIISNSYILVEFISSSKVIPINMDSISVNDTISYKIPLSSPTFSIESISSLSNKTVNKYKDNDINFYSFLIRFSYFIIFLSLIIMFLKYYFDNKRIDKYDSKLKKILKSYNSIIVNVSNIPNINKKDVIMVETFYELLNAQMELRVPINFIKEKNKSKFVIIGNSVLWMYILRRDDYEKKL